MIKKNIELSGKKILGRHAEGMDEDILVAYQNTLRLVQASFQKMYEILQEANDINNLEDYKDKVDEAVSEALLFIKCERGIHDFKKIKQENA